MRRNTDHITWVLVAACLGCSQAPPTPAQPGSTSEPDPQPPTTTTASVPTTGQAPSDTTADASVNQPPVAVVTATPTKGAMPLTVEFSGLASTDPDGQIIAHTWTLGDGSPTVEQPSFSHTYAAEGEFAVVLSVTDDHGATAMAEQTISVGGCPAYAPGQKIGTLDSAPIVEASGLAISRRSPGVMWTHNDSDVDGPRVYAFTLDGAPLGIYTLGGAKVRDWEDMALGPGPVGDRDYLYVGDIGDNNSQYPSITVYRAPEPPVDPAVTGVMATLGEVEAFEFTYPDTPHNAETLLIDPTNGDLVIVTKVLDGVSRVYMATAPLQSGTLEHVTTINFGLGGLTTGGAVSPNGDWVVIRTYMVARMWPRTLGTPLWSAFVGPGCTVPLQSEKQGEAITFTAQGLAYVTTSEGEYPPLWRYERM